MNIKVFSDIACPYCYIGMKRLKDTIQNYYPDELIEIEHKPFQLNPNLPKEENLKYTDHLMNNYGMSSDEVEEMINNMIDYGKKDNLEFNMKDIVNVNTFDAHRLIMFSSRFDKGQEVNERLMKAYFTEGRNVADFDVLADIGEEAGLNRDEVLLMLNSEDLVNELNAGMVVARYNGVSSVPFFIFDDYYSIKGAQPIEVFKDVIKESLNLQES